MDRYVMSDGAHDRWLAQAALDLLDDLPCWVRTHEEPTDEAAPRTVHLSITRRRCPMMLFVQDVLEQVAKRHEQAIYLRVRHNAPHHDLLIHPILLTT